MSGWFGKCGHPRGRRRVSQLEAARCDREPRAGMVHTVAQLEQRRIGRDSCRVGIAPLRGFVLSPEPMSVGHGSSPERPLMRMMPLPRGLDRAGQLAGRHDGRELQEPPVPVRYYLPVEDVRRRERERLRETRGDEMPEQSAFLAPQTCRVRAVNIRVRPSSLPRPLRQGWRPRAKECGFLARLVSLGRRRYRSRAAGAWQLCGEEGPRFAGLGRTRARDAG